MKKQADDIQAKFVASDSKHGVNAWNGWYKKIKLLYQRVWAWGIERQQKLSLMFIS